jgi:predicted TIM-barrel fold metal-dependent hydrolase
MDAGGVARAVLVPPSWEGDRNDLAIAAAQQWPHRFAVMGRISAEESPEVVARWRDQPGMLGVRIIFGPDSGWVKHGAAHPFWRAAADAGVPAMVAPVSSHEIVAQIADRFPGLRLALDHLGTGLVKDSQFAGEEEVLALASRPNVAVKMSAVPNASAHPSDRPWDDVEPLLRRLFEAYGPERCFWGSDLSRLPCPYRDLVEYFEHDLTWLRGSDLDLVMGAAIRKWLGWT